MPIPDLAQLRKMAARFAPVTLAPHVSGLSPGDGRALEKLIEAARLLNVLFLDQLWSGNRELYQKLQEDRTPLGAARLDYFWLNKGPWSGLDDHAAFVPDAPAHKPPGANFYPGDMTREEFENWIAGLPEEQSREATGFFTVIRRSADDTLRAVPYGDEYREQLEPIAALLREAAAATDNGSLRRYLELRAAALLSNDYYESDLAWMELDAPLDITFGPYETYNDELFGYKAAFEAYITIRDDAASERLKFFADHLQEIEDNLPIEARYRNPKLGDATPIRVVNQVYAAGDGAHGVRTAAFNLPNDERIVHEQGSKQVMLRNVQQAKFEHVLKPIAARVLQSDAQGDLSFDAFFTHILAHELSHGIGPHRISIGGRATSPRQELKETYSAIEEAKADITGLFLLQYLYDHGLLTRTETSERQMYTTFLASAFRSMRFGLNEAHGKGMAVQLNYLLDKGAFVVNSDGAFAVDYAQAPAAVRDLTGDILTIEAEGDYRGARQMLDELGVMRPEISRAIERLSDLPVDIELVDEREPAVTV